VAVNTRYVALHDMIMVDWRPVGVARCFDYDAAWMQTRDARHGHGGAMIIYGRDWAGTSS
jgi:hypothetical protein